MEYLIGIDIGTGSTKAVALNLNYEPIQTSQFFYPTTSSSQGYSEQEPALIWQAFINAINQLVAALGPDVKAIGLSAAMHSLIMVDSLGGVLAPMITWADSRSTQEANSLKQSDYGYTIYEETGTPIHPMSPLCKLLWLKKHNQNLFYKTGKFISIKEYIWFRLFGTFKIDYSIASATGLFNILNTKWDINALQIADIDQEKLSQPVPTNYTDNVLLADAAALLPGLKTTFVIGASDGCLANLGSEATTEGVAAITIGTSGAVRMASTKPLINRKAMTFNYILDNEIFICGGPVNNGGIALKWLLENIFEEKALSEAVYDSLFQSVATVTAGCEGLIFLPYLTGERAPIWDSEACGTFFGLNLRHKKSHMARAVIEGICYALFDVLIALESSSHKVSQINVSGGFIHSKVWMQILADITGKKLVLIMQEDASAVGAAYLAAKTINLSKDYPAFANLTPEVILPNRGNQMIYEKKFLIFKQVYANLSETMHQHLNS